MDSKPVSVNATQPDTAPVKKTRARRIPASKLADITAAAAAAKTTGTKPADKKTIAPKPVAAKRVSAKTPAVETTSAPSTDPAKDIETVTPEQSAAKEGTAE